MDLEYQGLGPEERMVLSQLFRELGKEERGGPEVEMRGSQGGQAAMPPAGHKKGVQKGYPGPGAGRGGTRTAPGICAVL